MRNPITALCLVCAALLMTGAATSSVEAQRSGVSSSTKPVTEGAAANAMYAPCSPYNPCATVSPALDAIPADAIVRQTQAPADNAGARSGAANPCVRGGNSGGRGRGGNAGGGFGNGGGADDPEAAARRAAFRARMAANGGVPPGRPAGAPGARPCGGGNRAGGFQREGAQAGPGKPD